MKKMSLIIDKRKLFMDLSTSRLANDKIFFYLKKFSIC